MTFHQEWQNIPPKPPNKESLREIKESGYTDFIGNNCDGLEYNCCFGWDGESRRCDCGNRRVIWNEDGFPEAY